MTQDVDSVPFDMPLTELVMEFERTHHHGFTVLDENGDLFGVVTLTDLEDALMAESLDEHSVADIAIHAGLEVTYPDETMATALWRMGAHGIGRLPVVKRDDPRKLVGVVRRSDIITAYEQAMARRTETSYRLKELREAHEGRVRVLEADIGASHPFLGKTVREIAALIPSDCILVSIRRGQQVVIPHGDNVVREGDHVVALTSVACAEDVSKLLLPDSASQRVVDERTQHG